MPLLVMRDLARHAARSRRTDTVVRRQIEYGAERGVPWGVSRVRVQREGRRARLPVPGVRRAGARAEARTVRRRRRGAVREHARAASRALGVHREPAAARARGSARAATATTRRSTTRPAVSRPGSVAPSSRRTWRTTRAWASSPSATSSRITRCGAASTPTRSSRRRSCCSRNACRASSSRPSPTSRRSSSSARGASCRRRSLAPTRPPTPPSPATHFLSNGRYSVMVTNAGGGYSRWKDLAVSRYREDITRDCWGQFVYIRDVASGTAVVGAATSRCARRARRLPLHPSRRTRPSTAGCDGDIETHMEVVGLARGRRRDTPPDAHEPRARARVALEVDLVLRGRRSRRRAPTRRTGRSRTSSSRPRRCRTSALLLFTRRPRSADETRYWGLHTLACDSAEPPCPMSVRDGPRALPRPAAAGARRRGGVRRARALVGHDGRGARPGLRDPAQGADPARRDGPRGLHDRRRRIARRGVAARREVPRHPRRAARDRPRLEDERGRAARPRHRARGRDRATSASPRACCSPIPYSRLKVKTRRENALPISALWGLGISGDHPILLVRIERLEDTAARARRCSSRTSTGGTRASPSTSSILNTPTVRLRRRARRPAAAARADRPGAAAASTSPGGVFLRREPTRWRRTSQPAAVGRPRDARRRRRPDRRCSSTGAATRPAAARRVRSEPRPGASPRRDVEFVRPALDFDNGYGGFDPETGEYVIVLSRRAHDAGALGQRHGDAGVRDDGHARPGVGCTWAKNSHENRLTTWNNDPVSATAAARSSTCATRRPARSGRRRRCPCSDDGALRRAARPRLHALRAHLPRHRAPAHVVRARRRPRARRDACS